jgi:glutathionyl-hydroquinone reductase
LIYSWQKIYENIFKINFKNIQEFQRFKKYIPRIFNQINASKMACGYY